MPSPNDGLPETYTDSRGRELAITDRERFNDWHLDNKLKQLQRKQATHEATAEDILLMQALTNEQARRGGPPAKD